MSIVPIVVYCLLAALFIFGLTFHDELLKEKQGKSKSNHKRTAGSLIVINGGKRYLAKHHSRP
ncbi:MAG: hypothetical protein WCC87_22760 [Candidatus Korobacteraceae bacterium]